MLPHTVNRRERMSDKELLELAAKAAGFLALKESAYHGGSYFAQTVDGWTQWDPLANDGDALRLAVDLRLCVGVGFSGTSVSDVSRNCLAVQMHKDDAGGATRRAIVRAAAEIGRAQQ